MSKSASQATTLEARIEALVGAAEVWQDASSIPRSALFERLFGPDVEEASFFTEASLTYELNRFMHGFTREHLSRCADLFASGGEPVSWCVRHPEGVDLLPLELQLYAWLAGDSYVGVLQGVEHEVSQAFWESVHAPGQDTPTVHAELADTWASVRSGHPPAGRLLDLVAEEMHETELTPLHAVQRSYAVAVLDGKEGDQALEGLAEDLLLHDGRGIRTPRLIWAPSSLSPDPLLDVLATFRGAIPGHPATPRRLKMQQAFLNARDVPHAYSEDLTFLISKGEPEVQSDGHFRWVAYDEPGEVAAWCTQQASASSPCSFIIARSTVADELAVPQQVLRLGSAHQPRLGDTPLAHAFRVMRKS